MVDNASEASVALFKLILLMLLNDPPSSVFRSFVLMESIAKSTFCPASVPTESIRSMIHQGRPCCCKPFGLPRLTSEISEFTSSWRKLRWVLPFVSLAAWTAFSIRCNISVTSFVAFSMTASIAKPSLRSS